MSLYSRLQKRFKSSSIVIVTPVCSYLIVALSGESSLSRSVKANPFLLRIRLRIAMRKLYRAERKLKLFLKHNEGVKLG